MLILHSSQTHTGLKHRDNEDRFLCSNELSLFAVADGLSGNQGGAIASNLALRTLEEFYRMAMEDEESSDPSALMLEAFHATNFTVFNQSLRQAEYIGMGTTLTAAVVGNGVVTIGHVGDSRCYLASPSGVTLLTNDHVREGIGAQRVLDRCVGFQEDVEVEIISRPYHQGDALLLCTDGVSDFVREPDFQRMFDFGKPDADQLRNLVNQIVKLANIRGSKDDATVVVVRSG